MHVTPGQQFGDSIFKVPVRARKGTVNTDARLGTSDARLSNRSMKCSRGDGRARFRLIAVLHGHSRTARRPAQDLREGEIGAQALHICFATSDCAAREIYSPVILKSGKSKLWLSLFVDWELLPAKS